MRTSGCMAVVMVPCSADLPQYFRSFLLLESVAVIGFEVVEERGGLRFQSQSGALAGKPLLALRVVVRPARFHRIGPRLDFRRRFRRAVFVQPGRDLFVARTRG